MKKLTGNDENCLEKNKKKRIISQNLLVSYLLILLAPVIAIGAIYFHARNAMLETQKERVQNVLSEAALSFEKEVEQAENVGYYISRERRLCDYLLKGKYDSKEQDFYALYTIASNYPNYSLTNHVIKNVFILVKDSQYVLRIPQVIPQTELGISTLDGFPFYSYEKFMEFYEQQDMTQMLFNYKAENGKQLLLLPCQVTYDYVMPGTSAIVVQLDWNQVIKLIRPVLSGKEGMVAVTDGEGRILAGREKIKDGGVLQGINDGNTLDEYLKHAYWGKNNLALFSVPLSYNGWKITAAIPCHVLTEGIGRVRYVIITLCIVAVFLGIAVCVSYWYQRKSMVQEYFRLQERLGAYGDGMKKENMWFWKDFDRFLVDVNNMQDTLEKQKDIIRAGFLEKLIYGTYESQTELLEDAEKAGISLDDQYYAVADMVFQNHISTDMDCSMEEFVSMLSQAVGEALPWKHWLYKVSDLSYVIIVHSLEQIRGEDLKAVLEKMNEGFSEMLHAQSYIGVGCTVKDPLEISRQFEVASRICEYYAAPEKTKEEPEADLDKEMISSYIEEHLPDPCLNLCMMAEWMEMPERKLYSDFKVCFGMSFSSYLEQRRIDRACQYLKQGMAVKETAEKTGYGSDYSFRRAFKRVMGIPPSDFRKMQT